MISRPRPAALCRARPRSACEDFHYWYQDARRLGLYRGPSHRRCNIGASNQRRRQPPPRPHALAFFDPPANNRPPTASLKGSPSAKRVESQIL
jgi:hypothetical protein